MEIFIGIGCLVIFIGIVIAIKKFTKKNKKSTKPVGGYKDETPSDNNNEVVQ